MPAYAARKYYSERMTCVHEFNATDDEAAAEYVKENALNMEWLNCHPIDGCDYPQSHIEIEKFVPGLFSTGVDLLSEHIVIDMEPIDDALAFVRLVAKLKDGEGCETLDKLITEARRIVSLATGR